MKEFDSTGRPLAAVCHGPQLLLSAELQRGRTLTAWKTIQSDLRQAGAKVKDQAVVEVDDGNFEAEIEKFVMSLALRESKGSPMLAHKLLRMPRRTFFAKLKKFIARERS